MSGRELDREYDAMSDEALCCTAKRGDRDAERLLVVRFMPLVRIKARPYFLIGADDADLVQEGAIGLFAAIRDYDEKRGVSFRTYAEKCISNNIIAAIKRASRKKHIPLNSYISLDRPLLEGDDEQITLADRLSAAGTSPEDKAIRNEEEHELASLLGEKLTDFEKQVLALFLDGKSYKQIGEETGRTAKAADNALQRVKKKVAELMKAGKNERTNG